MTDIRTAKLLAQIQEYAKEAIDYNKLFEAYMLSRQDEVEALEERKKECLDEIMTYSKGFDPFDIEDMQPIMSDYMDCVGELSRISIEGRYSIRAIEDGMNKLMVDKKQ